MSLCYSARRMRRHFLYLVAALVFAIAFAGRPALADDEPAETPTAEATQHPEAGSNHPAAPDEKKEGQKGASPDADAPAEDIPLEDSDGNAIEKDPDFAGEAR